jgi:hypothetical protein
MQFLTGFVLFTGGDMDKLKLTLSEVKMIKDEWMDKSIGDILSPDLKLTALKLKSHTLPKNKEISKFRVAHSGLENKGKIFSKSGKEKPYQLEIVKPRAINLKKFWETTGKVIPAEIKSALGANVPILLCHGMTPFANPGQIPQGIWGMGYEVKAQSPKNIDTVSLAPTSEMFDFIKVNQAVRVGLGLGGEMKIPDKALDLAGTISGIKINQVEVSATTNQEFSLAVNVTFSVVKIIAGPVSGGGARWDLYRQDKPLEKFQPFLQTVLVPEKTKKIKLSIKTWIKQSGWFGGIFGARQCLSEPIIYEVSLDGLS